MHKITEERFKDWFPKSNRFLHYCAKYYGFSFHNEAVVEEAAYQSMLNVKRLMDRGEEFDSEKRLMATVMWCFRYGILSAYDVLKRRNRLDCRSESEVTYGVGNEDDYSLYEAACIHHDKPYSNVGELISESMLEDLNLEEREIIKQHFYQGEKLVDIKKSLDLTPKQFRNSYNRALAKLKLKLKENEEKPNIKKQRTESMFRVRKSNRVESPVKDPQKDSNYSKAMSFLHP
jgi:RNA polymerase sigma factor (sigma-70 family)